MTAKRVIVYVEGPSDCSAMEELFAAFLERKRNQGVDIQFYDGHRGDAKKAVLTNIPRRAVNIILNDPNTDVVAMPDLYPKDKAFTHSTFKELAEGIRKNFEQALKARGAEDDARLRERFKVFCFKHDLEALILAAKEALARRLGASSLKTTWTVPVEDQDFDRPPKRVVEGLFRRHGKRYKNTVDAPIIMRDADHEQAARRCPQCFKPFVKFLESL